MKKIYLVVFFCAFALLARAENGADSSKVAVRKNFVKINLPTLALRTYALEYERAIGKKISASIGYRLMPKGGIPLKGTVNDLIDDPEVYKQLNSFELGNNAITPQIKFYFGKEVFKGFYLAPFARIAKYNANGLFNFDVNGSDEEMPLSGELKTLTGGLELGVNFRLSKRIYLNLNAGPQFGSSKGTFDGKKSLTPDEQNALRDELNDLDIPFVDKEVTVDQNGVKMKLDGPWGGIKAGLMLGFRF